MVPNFESSSEPRTHYTNSPLTNWAKPFPTKNKLGKLTSWCWPPPCIVKVWNRNCAARTWSAKCGAPGINLAKKGDAVCCKNERAISGWLSGELPLYVQRQHRTLIWIYLYGRTVEKEACRPVMLSIGVCRWVCSTPGTSASRVCVWEWERIRCTEIALCNWERDLWVSEIQIISSRGLIY